MRASLTALATAATLALSLVAGGAMAQSAPKPAGQQQPAQQTQSQTKSTSTTSSKPQVGSKYLVTGVQSSLNVRSGPGTNYQVVGSLRPKDSVTVVAKSKDGNWSQISFGPKGSKGWVADIYLTPAR